MKMKLIRETNLLILVTLLLCAIKSSCTEIRLLMSVFRHGDRYPMDNQITRFFYPRNPHANVSWFPDSVGGLTIEGKRRAFELGSILKERYEEFLGPTYSVEIVNFRSSVSERTTVTTELVAAALFPPIDSQRWNPTLNWQPIPVLPSRPDDNILFLGDVVCANYYTKYLSTTLTDQSIIMYNRKMLKNYIYVSRHTGAPATNQIMYYLYMEFLALVSGGYEPPVWSNRLPDGNLFDAAVMEYRIASWNDDLKRFTGGVWLKEWFDLVDAYLANDSKLSMESSRKNGNVKKKAFFYGGHDLNIAGIMVTLGIYYSHVPNYASAVNFELHEDDDHQYYVKVLHRDSGIFSEYLVTGCDNVLCPLDTFKKNFARVTPQNLTEECGHHVDNFIP